MDVVELLPQLHFLRFAIGHAYLWADSDGLTLIDAGAVGSADAIAGAIRSLGHQPGDVRWLVLTHFHRDHVGSAAAIAGWGDVVVHAHQAEAAIIRGDAVGPEAVLLDWERELQARSSALLPPGEPDPVRVDREVVDGDELGFGDAQAVWVPGHTPGSLAVYLRRARVLFTGDTIARAPDGRLLLGVFNVDRTAAIASLRRQATLDVDIACFGHGEPLLENTTEQLRTLAERQQS